MTKAEEKRERHFGWSSEGLSREAAVQEGTGAGKEGLGTGREGKGAHVEGGVGSREGWGPGKGGLQRVVQ